MSTPRETPDAPSVTRSGERLPAPIDGVRYERLTVHADHRGQLVPAFDPAHPFWDEPVVWAYNWTLRPGRIKGWGMHEEPGRPLLRHRGGHPRRALRRPREDSPSHQRFHVVDFTRGTPGLLRIPPGVWHASQNWGDFEAVCMNFPTAAFDPEHPDKYRIDPHSGEIPFDFTLRDY